MKRLWALLVALCAAGILLASPFLLGAIRAVQSPMAPPVLLTLQVLQTLLLCALAAYAGVRFAPAAGLDAPWLRALAEGRSPPLAFGRDRGRGVRMDVPPPRPRGSDGGARIGGRLAASGAAGASRLSTSILTLERGATWRRRAGCAFLRFHSDWTRTEVARGLLCAYRHRPRLERARAGVPRQQQVLAGAEPQVGPAAKGGKACFHRRFPLCI